MSAPIPIELDVLHHDETDDGATADTGGSEIILVVEDEECLRKGVPQRSTVASAACAATQATAADSTTRIGSYGAESSTARLSSDPTNRQNSNMLL